MKPPALSIIVLSYNVEPWLDEALWSARRQTFTDLEIIVVDDGSTDGSWGVTCRHERDDARVRGIRQDNRGLVGARNTGLAAVRGEFVAYLDGDDRWLPEKAARHVAHLRHDASLDASFSWYRVIDEDGKDTGRYGRPRPGTCEMIELLTENFVWNGQPVMRRSAIEQIGAFDPTMTGSDDHEFVLRIGALRDRSIACIPEVLAEYRRRRGQLTKDLDVMHRGWLHMMDRMRAVVPDVVARVEREATARHYRFLGYVAWEGRQYAQAREYTRRAWLANPLALAKDRRAWLTTAAVLAGFLPERTREPLRRAAERLRARMDVHPSTS